MFYSSTKKTPLPMRRVSANYIISPNLEPIRNGVLEFDEGGVLTQIIDPKGEELAGVEWYNGVLVPGFVNAHCHLELSQLKGIIPPNQGMTGFIKGIFANNGKSSFDEQCVIEADREMFREGIVAVGDISNHAQSLAVKAKSSIYYHTFFESLGLNPQTANATAERIKDLIQTANSHKLKSSACPHAFYSMSEHLWDALLPLFENQIVSFHHLESDDEAQFIYNGNGELFQLMNSISPDSKITTPQLTMGMLLNQYLHKAKKLLLVHNGALTLCEFDLYKQLKAELYFVICPLSNLYIGNPIPDSDILHQFSSSICIGTDSLSSNTRLSICEEMKYLTQHYPQLPFNQLLQWATLNGASALDIDKQYGSFEKGKTPRAVLLSHFDFETFRLTNKSTARRIV